MSAQYLEYIRQELITATADLSGATKGQLLAWVENAQFDTNRFRRKKLKARDEVTGKMITMNNPPLPGKQSRAKGSSIALVQPIEFVTASWRRALFSLDETQKAWLLWNYSENIRFEYQIAITQWVWTEFKEQMGTRKVAGKTMERLKMLIWLAAQDVKAELAGRESYQCQKLAELVEVNKTNWSQNYAGHWDVIKKLFERLDRDSLISLSRSRSQQKASNLMPTIAEMN